MKADEFAKEGAMLDGELTAQVVASTVQQEREEVNTALQHAASFRCLVEEWKWTFVNKKGEAKKHVTEWCATCFSLKNLMTLLSPWHSSSCLAYHKELVSSRRNDY